MTYCSMFGMITIVVKFAYLKNSVQIWTFSILSEIYQVTSTDFSWGRGFTFAEQYPVREVFSVQDFCMASRPEMLESQSKAQGVRF